jgi:hypothetical protein
MKMDSTTPRTQWRRRSVAATIASGLAETGLVTLTVVFAGLAGAIVWNLLPGCSASRRVPRMRSSAV